MNTELGKTGLQISRIGLGTVEIGLPYGLGNTGLPSEQEAISVLKNAVEMGVTYIDTARGYGLAEERIGKSGVSKNENIVIGTKCGQFLKNAPELTGKDLEMRIREEIGQSRAHLQQEVLQLVQIHNELEDYTNFSEIIEIMQKLKDEGKVQHVGIAIRGEAAATAALATGFFETIQTAYNIVDQRMAPSVFPKAKEQGVGVINRSVLLKGALTNVREKLPSSLSHLKENADKAALIAESMNISLPTLALRFVLTNPAISTALIGTTKIAHIQAAIEAASEGPLPEDVIIKLRELTINTPDQIDPAKWPKVD
jgi:1-deoxyxylulose-5-phosphate synthase